MLKSNILKCILNWGPIYCSNDMYPKLFLKDRSTLLWMWLQEWTHLVGCVVGHTGVVTLLPPPPVLDHHLHVTHCYKGFGEFRCM